MPADRHPHLFAFGLAMAALAAFAWTGGTLAPGRLLLGLAAADLAAHAGASLAVALALASVRKQVQTVVRFLDDRERGLGRRIVMLLAADRLAGLLALAGALALAAREAPGLATPFSDAARPAVALALGTLATVYAYSLARAAIRAASAPAVARELRSAATVLGRVEQVQSAAGWGVRLFDAVALGGLLGAIVEVGLERWGVPAAERELGRQVARRALVRALGVPYAEPLARALVERRRLHAAGLLATRAAAALLPRAGAIAAAAFFLTP